jgi:hypothetical protein
MSAAKVTELIVADNHAADDRSGLRLLKRHRKELVMLYPLENAASGLLWSLRKTGASSAFGQATYPWRGWPLVNGVI